jgi:hypothetical protein
MSEDTTIGQPLVSGMARHEKTGWPASHASADIASLIDEMEDMSGVRRVQDARPSIKIYRYFT